MKVYAVVDEYYSYECTMDSDFRIELFASLEDAKTYLECLKEECLNFYKDCFDCETVEDLMQEVFEEFEEDDMSMNFEIYDDCAKFLSIQEYDVMSFKKEED